MNQLRMMLMKIFFLIIVLNTLILINQEWIGFSNISLFPIIDKFIELQKIIFYTSVIAFGIAIYSLSQKYKKLLLILVLLFSSLFNIIYSYKHQILYQLEQYNNPNKIIKKDGIEKEYNVKNELIRITEYSNNLKNGLEKIYNNGGLLIKNQYKDGRMHGISKSYFKNGELRKLTFMKNGKIVGIEKVFYENGNLYFIRPYVNGKLNGLEKMYYKNGKIFSEKHYKDGFLDGLSKLYSIEGILTKECTYEKQEKIAKCKENE